MLKLHSLISRFAFAKSKDIQVHGLFNNRLIGKYTSPNNDQMVKMLSDNILQQKQWLKVPQTEKQATIQDFYSEMQSDTNANQLINLLSQCVGKQISQCEAQVRVSLKILKNHLNYPYEVIRTTGKNYYKFEPFDSVLSVFDHRHPLLSVSQYLGLALRSNNSLFLRPSHNVLPVVEHIQKLWQKCCKVNIIHSLIDPYLDPKNQNSPVKNFLVSTQGFINFSGRIKDGFDFHYYISNQNQVFRQNELLLTSSDSAYIVKDLSPQQLVKAAKIVGRGCFSNCGHNFNSIKRIFVDRQIGDKFLQLIVEQSKLYTIDTNIIENAAAVNINQGTLAPYLLNSQFQQSSLKLNILKDQHKDQLKLIFGGQNIKIKAANREVNFITPSIFKVQVDFPNFNYQNEQYMMPICFVSFVDSPSDCVQKINSSIYGITSSIFTHDNSLQNVQKIGKKLDVGTINVNTWQVTDGITYSGRKRSGKGFSFSPLSFNNIVRSKAVSYA